MTTPTTFKQLPAVLSFQRGLLVTDAPFYNLIGERETDYFRDAPVRVIRHGIRATQNVSEGAKTSEKTGTRDVANIQQTESAKLRQDATGLVVEFSLRPLELARTLHACGSGKAEIRRAMRESVDDFIARALDSEAVMNVSLRYARNVLNGRWLWRNRIVADSVAIQVFGGDESIAEVDALTVPTDHFDEPSDAERAVARRMVEAFGGKRGLGMTVRATLEFGATGVLEVYPSQNYVERVKGYARSLYKLPGSSVRIDRDAPPDIIELGTAALRDQKIGNALRTIDTWYDDYPNVLRAIPVEPRGASLDLLEFFRSGQTSAFKLLGRLAEIDPESDDGLFVIATMIRGGVFGESEKEEKQAAGKTADTES